MILFFGWSKVNNHVTCDDCRGTLSGATSTAFQMKTRKRIPSIFWQSHGNGSEMGFQMTNRVDIFTIDIKALTDRYKAYCAEQGIGPGVWRYRYLFGLPMALAIAGLTFALYAYWDPFHPAGSFRPAPAFHAGLAFVMAYLLCLSGILGLYFRHCVRVLIRAGIEVPTVLPAPSIVETFRKRPRDTQAKRALSRTTRPAVECALVDGSATRGFAAHLLSLCVSDGVSDVAGAADPH